MKAVATIVLGAAALLSGCGQLSVRVDVLDPEHVRNEISDERLRKQYRDIVAAAPGELAARMEKQGREYALEMYKLASRFEEVGAKLGAGGKGLQEYAASLRAALDQGEPVRNVIVYAGRVESLAQDVRMLPEALQWAGRGSMPSKVRDLVLALEAATKAPQVTQLIELREAKRSLDRLLARVAVASPGPATTAAPAAAAPEVKAATDQATAVNAVIQRSIIGDGSLAATDFAYAVARAPEPLWANNFNRAFANGTFGNSDIVIRLNSTADFSVKGMLFDASKVAQVASKVMTQAVLLGSQMAGVPVATVSTGTTTGGDSLSRASADLATADGAIARRQAMVISQRDAVRSMARTILGSALPLETDATLKTKDKDDPARAPLHKAIDDTFTALKPLLSLQDLQ